jgi:hypothetical protein
MTLPNAKLAGVAASCPAVDASPDTVTDTLVEAVCEAEDPEAEPTESDALPLTVTLPVNVPGVFGANVTVSMAVCPGVSVAGRLSPLMAKAELLAESCEIVTPVLPALVMVAVFAELCPTRTLPKAKDAGLASSFPAATAVPDTATSISPADAMVLLMAIFPAGVPVVCGVKEMLKGALCPGANMKGIVGDVTRKEASDTVALAIVTAARDWFITVFESCLLAPTTTVPKFMFALPTTTALLLEPLPKSAPQPDMTATEKRRRERTAPRSQRELRSIG